ncbi:phage antirepressor KilAC domain-containing protein [Chromobacterium haemolyticum]|uniref:phage antirepressor KilAC domain-containing protein n=1 Tax=Chromobacterium haemolyticum TaxID=394935 RepID=UPI0002D52286|nr:phage regulatory protein/antirepressor Ant [Chromobacterium haemolyticum]
MELMTLTAGQPLTMSSREISELCDKEHKNVIRDIRVMFTELKIEPSKFEDTYQDVTGRSLLCFALDKELSMTLVAGYNVVLRNRIIKRWMELEQKTQQPDPIQVLNDPAAMRGLLLTYTEKVLSLESKVESMAPKVEALERISEADGASCITNAAKALQLRPKDLFTYLNQHRWIYKRPGSAQWTAYQDKIQSGVLEHKVTTVSRSDGSEKIVEQVLVTPKGLAKLAQTVSTRH